MWHQHGGLTDSHNDGASPRRRGVGLRVVSASEGRPQRARYVPALGLNE